MYTWSWQPSVHTTAVEIFPLTSSEGNAELLGMLHLSDDGFRRFSLARPQTVRETQKLWGCRLRLSLTHNLSSAHTHTWIKIQLWACLPLCSSIISYTERLMRQLASRQMAFQICSDPFVYFSDFGRVWKSFADAAAHSDVMAGFCSCRVAGKMCTLVVSKQLKFYYKWFHICTRRGEKTRLGFERWRPLWGQIPLNAASHSRKSLSNRRPKEEKHFGTILPLLLRYFGHCCLAIKHQSVKAYPGSSEQQLGPWWAFGFLVSFAIDTFSDFF